MMRKHITERGQALLMASLSLFLMFGMLGLAVDLGWAYYTRMSAQAAADAAALAAAKAALSAIGQTGNFSCGSGGVACQSNPTACPNTIPNPPNNLEYGCLYARSNGFTPGGRGGHQNVTMRAGVSSSAPTVPGVRTNYWVTAEVSEQIPQLFSALIANGMLTPSVRATAGVVGTPLGACIYVLDPHTQNAFVVSGPSNVRADCGIVVDSDSEKAMVVSGSACVTGSDIDVVGNYVKSSSCPITPVPTIRANYVGDPLAGLQPPPYGGCDHVDYSLSGGGSDVLNPGVYCGGITINGTVAFNSGVYVLLGGGLTVSGGSTVSGTGVSFFNTADAQHAYKPVTISGTSTAILSAPDVDQPLEGILFYQDRSLTSSSKNAISGGSGSRFTGALYFPTTPLVYSGGSSTNANAVTIIARTLEFSGGSYLKEPDINNGGLLKRIASLIE